MMMRIDNHSRTTLLLLLACIALSIVVAVIWHGRMRIEYGAADGAERLPSVDDNVSESGFSAPAITTFPDILERPLFTEGRKPPTPAQTPTLAEKPAPLRLQVEGVALTPDARIAVVRDLGNGKLLRLPEGSSFQGWTLENVNPTGVLFRKDGETQEFVLDPLKNTFRRR